MNIFKSLKSLFKPKHEERLALLERNFIVLLKRVLEMDGVKLVAAPSGKVSDFDSKILKTPGDETQPTIH